MRYMISILLLLFTSFVATAQDNVLDVNISNPQPYIGEVITYTIRFTSSLDLSNVQIQPPSFIGFAQQPNTPTLSTSPANNVILNVVEQDFTLYANQTGGLLIDPTTIIIPESPFQSGIEVTGETLSLNVLSLPEGAPDTFTGGVGQFDINVAIDKPTVQAGEPNLLQIAITGIGNFSQLNAPQLDLPPNWEVFESSSSTVNTTTNLQTKTFEYQFFANQSGNISIPSILFTYFDPITASYQTIVGEAGTFDIEGEFASNQSNNTVQSTNRLTLKPMSDRPEAIIPSNLFWLLWLIAPVLALSIFVVRTLTRPRQTPTAQTTRRQSKSLQTVTTQLSKARQSDPNQAYAIVQQTILHYLSAKYKQDVTLDNLSHMITNLPANLQQRLNVCMEQARSGQYAPVTQEDAEKLIRRTYKTLQLVEEQRIK